MKSLFVAAALLASWLTLNAEGAESPWAGAGLENSWHPPAGRGVSRSPKPVVDGISSKTVLHQVVPEYPYEARRSRISGYGTLFGQVDFKTGLVTSVRMEKSTGNTLLDHAALNAFRQWRFKPGTVCQFRTPISFTVSHW